MERIHTRVARQCRRQEFVPRDVTAGIRTRCLGADAPEKAAVSVALRHGVTSDRISGDRTEKPGGQCVKALAATGGQARGDSG
jgi:hypothetical protein